MNIDINNEKYSKYILFIENQRTSNKSWDDIKFFNQKNGNIEEMLNNFALMWGIEAITVDEWESLIEDIIKRDKEIKISKLGRNAENDATISENYFSSWQSYRRSLIKKGFSEKSILNIEKSSLEILKSLKFSTQNSGPVKGLVVGNVQSGKTANMAGLMAMAADNGFNYFIILSGLIENLRQQTANRLYSDLKGENRSSLHWNHIDNPSLGKNSIDYSIENLNLSKNSKERYITVCLKHYSRLNKLKKWLTFDKNQANNMKILVIDDEADQASINTKDINTDVSRINDEIKDLVNNNSFKAMNYVSYTATPYANVLNETTEDSLYPKDFITLLEPSEDYIGPTQIFGMEEPEVSPHIDIVKEINETDANLIKDIQKGDTNQDIPRSFKKSIQWFLLTVCAMRTLNYKKPISMLVHTSFKVEHHENIARKVINYIKYIKENFQIVIKEMKELYLNEQHYLNKELFIKEMPNYSTKDNIPQYPVWSDVLKELKYLVSLNETEYINYIYLDEDDVPIFNQGIHLSIDNSRTRINNEKVRLIYPDKNNMPNVAPAFIVIGGNTLSRGLTLEGLTTTYFLRTTNQADTLMQMGRWFGYRKEYEIFPRIWLDDLAYQRFLFLSQLNEELKDEIKEFSKTGNTPKDYAPRIKNSPNYKLIRITSNNKQQSAEIKEFDFFGFNSQTIYFERNTKILNENLNFTKEFLNSLSEPSVKKNKLIWRNVENNKIKDFLTKYQVSKKDKKMKSLPQLIEWLEKNSESLKNWNVILSGKGEVEKIDSSLTDEFNIHGYKVESVVRTKLREKENVISIGTLRRPEDLYADIEENLSIDEGKSAKMIDVRSTREKYGYGNIPQLIIYRINKGNKKFDLKKSPNGEYSRREKLDFPQDIIGINIMLPGVSKGNNATYIAANIDFTDEVIDEDEFKEDFKNEEKEK